MTCCDLEIRFVSPVLARDPGQAQKNTTPPSVFFRFIVHLPVLADRFFLFFLSLSRRVRVFVF
ncbi:unnamed protein product [Citrullus colocynthis]|uniref:Uncharacterized protein n=1 Tax=Citrullus colocynthis TaxID=252529 RepID=A0ABP0Z324_9ROSI